MKTRVPSTLPSLALLLLLHASCASALALPTADLETASSEVRAKRYFGRPDGINDYFEFGGVFDTNSNSFGNRDGYVGKPERNVLTVYETLTVTHTDYQQVSGWGFVCLGARVLVYVDFFMRERDLSVFMMSVSFIIYNA